MPRHDRATEHQIAEAEDEIAAALGVMLRLTNAARLTTDEDVLGELAAAMRIARQIRDRWIARREDLDIWPAKPREDMHEHRDSHP